MKEADRRIISKRCMLQYIPVDIFRASYKFFMGDKLKGHGNEADFLGVLQKSVRHRFLTLNFEPFGFGLRIRGDIRNRKTTRRVGESTRMPLDTIFFKPLNQSMVIVHNIPAFLFAKFVF